MSHIDIIDVAHGSTRNLITSEDATRPIGVLIGSR